MADRHATLAELPLSITVEHAGSLLGLGRSQAYSAAMRGDIPTVRIGERKLVVPTAALIRKFNLDGAHPAQEW